MSDETIGFLVFICLVAFCVLAALVDGIHSRWIDYRKEKDRLDRNAEGDAT